ncbi:gamma-aminobutyric acid receptor alpha-like isoform X2 [Nematostella vectensis]|nr:gamma-aminobutyric acid receptor alpha-like isoform X2 [Nematostella vectensis]
MYLRQEWNDPRLAHGYRALLSLAKDRVNDIWLPDTYFNNANEYEVYIVNQLSLIKPNGDIYYSGRNKVKGACQMDLFNFPLDVQRCSLVLESFAYTGRQIDFKWKEINPVVIFNKDLAEFDVTSYEISERNATYVAGVYKNLVVTFTFKRRMGFYFIQFYIPCIVMVTLSWISFWMDRYYIGERVSLGITTVLTIVFLLGSSNSTMPRVSYAKAIDWYLIGSFMFVFSTLVTDLLVYRFSIKSDARRDEGGKDRYGKERTQQVTFKCKHGFKPTYVAEPNGEVHVVSYQEEKSTSVKETLANCCLPMACPEAIRKNNGGKSSDNMDFSVVMNKCCRFMYPAAFGLFNVVYWTNLFVSSK